MGDTASAHRVNECAIGCRRGYAKSRFFALVEPLSPDDGVLESPGFWSLGKSSPKPDGRAAAAHQQLVEVLLQQGWEPAGVGAVWYQQQFRRREEVPSSLKRRWQALAETEAAVESRRLEVAEAEARLAVEREALAAVAAASDLREHALGQAEDALSMRMQALAESEERLRAEFAVAWRITRE